MDVLKRLKDRTGEENVELLSDLMESAQTAIMNRRFPYGDWPTDEYGDPKMDARYQDLQFRIALDLYNKIGAEGELSHSENGIGRSYESSWISEQLLSEVTPLCGVTN